MNYLSKIYNYLVNYNYSLWIVIFNLIIILLILTVSIFAYKSDTVMFKAVDLFDEKTQKAIQLGKKRDQLMKFIDEINIFSSKLLNIKSLPDVPVFDI